MFSINVKKKTSNSGNTENPETNKPVTRAAIAEIIGENDDINITEIKAGECQSISLTMVFVDGMVNTAVVDENILKPLQTSCKISRIKNEEALINEIMMGAIPHNSIRVRDSLQEVIQDILGGSVAFIFDQSQKAVLFDIKGFEKRAVSEPSNEKVIKGGKDSFIEMVRSNTALVRVRLQNEKLKVKELIIGKEGKTRVAVFYLDGKVDQNILNDVLNKLNRIESKNITSSSLIEDKLSPNKFSLFPQLLYTERPDKFCAYLAEGKVGVIINGIPNGYILPATLNMFMQAPEDYSYNFIVASFIRILRYIALAITLTLPAYYISVTTFHQEMIPRELAISIIKSKEGVPFTTTAEVLFFLFAFELLIEAGVRMPKAIGQALSIVGAIVIGEAAVSAKFISTAVIVVIALSAIAGFAIPNQDFTNAIRICRLILVLCASFAGFLGVVFGLMFLGFRLSSLNSYGLPYFYPYAGSDGRFFTKDSLIRLPVYLKRKYKK